MASNRPLAPSIMSEKFITNQVFLQLSSEHNLKSLHPNAPAMIMKGFMQAAITHKNLQFNQFYIKIDDGLCW